MKRVCFGLFLLLMVSLPVSAALQIEITQGVEGALPIAIVPFYWEGSDMAARTDVSMIVEADLYRSGRFAPLPAEDFLAFPHERTQVNFKDWRILGVEYLVIGRMRPAGAMTAIEFQLFDVFSGERMAGYTIRSSAAELRYKTHQISDIIYESIIGVPGAFATRIAYVTQTKDNTGQAKYSLYIADADGFNPRPVLHSREPVMSPSWSPDGQKIAYVSFEDARPVIYIQAVASGKREMVSNAKGLNGAPSWSPDGQQMALVLSKDGNPEIYTLNLRTRALTRLTRSYAIDTEPVWSPSGDAIVFTSDRGGKPQLYRVTIPGGAVTRLTFEGKYNARASFSPDGKRLAMVHGAAGKYHIAVLELATGALQVLTDGALDESPSFAPNGSMIIYASQKGQRGVLAAVSVDGGVKQRLMLQIGDTREPAWSPFVR